MTTAVLMPMRKKHKRTIKLTIPHNFEPRDYQLPVFKALDDGIKRLVSVIHRRAGKDKVGINLIAREAMRSVGAYYYAFPTYKQGKRVIWQGMDRDGFKFLDHFPPAIVKSKNETDMMITLINGSTINIIGTDNIDAIMGGNPKGVVFSEFSLQDPKAWDLIRPILKENGGWAYFNYTPRGKNHGFKLYNMAKNNNRWFAQLHTVADTGVLSEADIQEERDEGMSEELIQQEYYCSFQGIQEGSYYAKQFAEISKDSRISSVAYEPTMPVHTWWDLGISDAMSIWFVQLIGQEIRVIDYHEDSGEGFPYYAKVLQDKGYVYGTHIAPHDITVRELGTGVSRQETAKKLGIDFKVAPKLSVSDGIDAVRAILGRCWFDSKKTEHGVNALLSYHKEWDDNQKQFKSNPYHDWASHGSDAFRTGAVMINKIIEPVRTLVKPIASSGAGWMGA